jgi:aspartate kinase
MGLIVQKYGGTSVADIDRIRSVARRVWERKDGNEPVAVLGKGRDTDRRRSWVTK